MWVLINAVPPSVRSREVEHHVSNVQERVINLKRKTSTWRKVQAKIAEQGPSEERDIKRMS